MEKQNIQIKNNLFKNIFYIFFALCFLSAGILTLNKTQVSNLAVAEDVSSEEFERQNVPEYFLAQEFLRTPSREDETVFVDTLNEASLIGQNIFLFSSDETSSNFLKLSLATNGKAETGHSIYNYVYYPNTANTSLFQFYDIASLELSINGVSQDLPLEQYVETFEHGFQNASSLPPEKFEINFTAQDADLNNFCIMEKDAQGRITNDVKEGLYTLTLKYSLITCTDGKNDETEAAFSVDTTLPPITFSFYVVDKASYLKNNLPIIDKGAFDSEVSNYASTSTTAYTLYSNYTSKIGSTKADGTISVTDENQIPYVEYDFTKFELSIRKSLSENVEYARLMFNKDSALNETEMPVVADTSDSSLTYFDVHFTIDTDKQTCKVYFTDLGVYTITLSAIKVVKTENAVLKYSLSGMSGVLKNAVANIFGYQATYTDFDQAPDGNNIRPTKELKELERDDNGNLTGNFINGADITSSFINSKNEYSQDDTSTFTRANIVKFINDNKLSPVKTNQTPIKFLSNATLATGLTAQSYVLSTERRSGFTETSSTVPDLYDTQTLYYKNFTGQTENSEGIYIYIIAYTFSGHSDPRKTFYQVFFFEIDKGTPTISVTTNDGATDVYSGKFVNSDVTISDLTKIDSFNKDITVQVYAYDYTSTSREKYMDDFGGVYGKSLENLKAAGSINNVYMVKDNGDIVLQANAKYTILLYNTYELNDKTLKYSTNIENPTGFISKQEFTIDQIAIDNIKGRNVSDTANGYQIINDIQVYDPTTNTYKKSFATNQSMVLSWDKKESGATSWAYYRYFPLVSAQYYAAGDTTSSLTNISSLLADMLSQGENNQVLPVNSVLDLSAKNNWIPLSGNTENGGGNTTDFADGANISSEYVLSDAGLYLVDVFDAAGNHKLDIFFIDNTTPIFALRTGLGAQVNYSLTTPTNYVDATSTLYWGNYKGIYISNFNYGIYENFDANALNSLSENDKKIYFDQSGQVSDEIYKLIYEALFAENHMQVLRCTNTVKPTGISELIDSYTGAYMTIKISDVSYYSNTQTTSGEYVKATGQNQTQIVVGDQEFNHRVLIRDISNTKKDMTLNDDEPRQYTNYYSARQIIKVSFDDSQFVIKTSDSENADELSAFLEDETTETGNRVKTSYLSPTSANEAFTLSFIPTITDSEKKTTTQVESVIIQYYRYITTSYTSENGITYYYKTLSDSAETTTVYLAENGEREDAFTYKIGISNTEQKTNAGKYVITRTYKTDAGYSYNSTKDFYKRTYVLIVDRNEVVSSPENVGDGHSESLVGGDVFVAMFDNGFTSNLVVTFPNSSEGNTDGQTISSNSGRTILTTNKLPVNIYIPQYKYTKYVSSIKTYDQAGNETSSTYKFEVENNDDVNYYRDELLIKEYALFAQLFKNGNLIAATAYNPRGSAGIDDVKLDGNGFLQFWDISKNQALTPLTDAGVYTVRIYQGWFFGDDFGTTPTEFMFEIKSATPDFVAQQTDGLSLYVEDNDTITASRPYSQKYQTNNSEIFLTWEASTDNYMVQIDVDKITLTTKDAIYTTADDIWTQRPFRQDNHTYLAQLNLEKLSGVYENEGWVNITMQFENHNSSYKTVTKQIYVDLSAPNNNINTLVSNSISGTSISSLTENALRTYQTAKLQEADDYNNTSYNISKNSGTFAYYSYAVSDAFITTLKNSIDYKTYVRKFDDGQGNNTKYSTDSKQETAPNEFTPNDFTELNERTVFDKGCYYEIVETDRAGNKTIYTIFIMDYENETNIISYDWTDSNTGATQKKSYTNAEYDLVANKSGAIHNIFSKTGFALTDINFFGDEWAQINLTTRSASGAETTRTLMLTPHDKGYALVFVGNATPQRVAISSLINGSIGSIYKQCISIKNRENLKTENFYVNIYNTTLSASLTDRQEEEYIRFNRPTDAQLQNPRTISSAFLTSLTITAYTPTETINVYGDRDENNIVGEGKNPLGYFSDWTSNDNVQIDTTNQTYLKFNVVMNFSSLTNARIVYEYTDNYGTTYREIHIYRETVISKEISSANGDLYSFLDDNGTEYYITSNNFQYNYNPNKYTVQAYAIFSDGSKTNLADADASASANVNNDGTYTYTVSTFKNNQYNNAFVLEVRDANNPNSNTNLIKEIRFILYNELPTPNTGTGTYGAGEFRFVDGNGTNITEKIIGNTDSELGYFSEVRLLYAQKDSFIPVKYSISTDRQNWTEIASGTRLRSSSDQMEKYYIKIWYDEQYLLNNSGNPMYVFGNVLPNQIFEFNLSSLTATFWVEKTVNGITSVVQKDNSIYIAPNGARYSNHYIVNLAWVGENNNPVEIKVNKEQEITKECIDRFEDGIVVSELWKISNADKTQSNIPAFETYIVISYIPASSNFVERFFATNANGIIENDNLISKTSASVIIPEKNSSIDKVMIQWSKYYGIYQNEISVRLVKDGLELNPEIYSTGTGKDALNYTYLTYSGKYTITLYDKIGNVQKFNFGDSGQTENFTFTFLKDVPFTVTYTDIDGEEQTTLPIKQAVYNGAVTLNIDENTLSEFYSWGGYPKISVKRNGVDYAKEFADNATQFTFDETGYYEVTFTAQHEAETIRQETYQFSIINPNEHNISYVFNQYSNYYVARVLKDGRDVTAQLVSRLDAPKTVIDGQQYLTQLPISYLDDKTGVGTYTITICSNNRLFKNSDLVTDFTFVIKINKGTAPLDISLAEGESTTSRINIKFNSENIFNEMGECILRIVRQNDSGTLSTISTTAINAESTGEESATIDQNGTFFIQIVSPSGTLLFSYKVTKNAPMNAASIIAIVISIIVLIAVIFIVIKLRKRIAVK